MRFWNPDPDEPQLLDWWMPLIRAGRRTVDAELHWLILVDEWHLAGRVIRRPRPDVWIYVHRDNGRELYVDDSGQTYRFRSGRFTETSVRNAVWAAGLPQLAGVG